MSRSGIDIGISYTCYSNPKKRLLILLIQCSDEKVGPELGTFHLVAYGITPDQEGKRGANHTAFLGKIRRLRSDHYQINTTFNLDLVISKLQIQIMSHGQF